MALARISAVGIMALAGSVSAQLKMDSPPSTAVSPARIEHAADLLRSEVASNRLGAASILVARHGRVVLHRGFGRLSQAPGAPAVQPDSVFLLASITKPVTACALMLLVERGLVSLGEAVTHYLPDFRGGERGKIQVRDLLRHTSGLPDMLPENIELRRAHAPLSEFVRRTYATPLLFSPRSEFRYQSMGILLAAEMVEKISGMRLRDFEKKEIFDPLGMKDSSLGLGGRRLSDVVSCSSVPGTNRADDESYGPNSPYWRDMGCPWGGMHSSTSDVARLLQTFLDGGVYAGRRVFSPATVHAMTSDQNAELCAP